MQSSIFLIAFSALCFVCGLYLLIFTKRYVKSYRDGFLKSGNQLYAKIYGGIFFYIVVKIMGLILLCVGSFLGYAVAANYYNW